MGEEIEEQAVNEVIYHIPKAFCTPSLSFIILIYLSLTGRRVHLLFLEYGLKRRRMECPLWVSVK
jgi:hypothetical protein